MPPDLSPIFTCKVNLGTQKIRHFFIIIILDSPSDRNTTCKFPATEDYRVFHKIIFRGCPRYGRVILVSRYSVLTADNWSQLWCPICVHYQFSCAAKTRLRHPSLPFDSLPYPTQPPAQSVGTYARSITWQANEKRLTILMSMGLKHRRCFLPTRHLTCWLTERSFSLLKGQCPDYAHARASSVFSLKDNRTVILTRQDFLPDRTADGDLLFTILSNILDFRRSFSSYLNFNSRYEDSSRFCR